MFAKYDELKEIKQEIQKYTELVNREKIFKNDNFIIAITKKMIFFKSIVQPEMNSHYTQCMVCDMLLLSHSLTQDSLKGFYIIYRSYMENFIRYILALEGTDSMGVRNLFNSLKIKYQTKESIEYIRYLEGEYGKCCEYIHSNINAKYNIYQYYQDILKNDEMSERVIIGLSKRLVTFFDKSIRFIIENKYNVVDRAYYRKKQELKYLIGIDCYTLFNSFDNLE